MFDIVTSICSAYIEDFFAIRIQSFIVISTLNLPNSIQAHVLLSGVEEEINQQEIKSKTSTPTVKNP